MPAPWCATMKSSAPRGACVPALRRFAVAMHTLGKAPGPNRHRCGREQRAADLAQHLANPLLFGGANIGQRPAGLEDLPKGLGRAAFNRLIFYRIVHREIAGVVNLPDTH